MERIVRNDEAGRYELYVDDELASLAEFESDAVSVRFPHTETAPAFRGQGLAEKLVRWALDDVNKQGLRPVPLCSFVADVIARSAA